MTASVSANSNKEQMSSFLSGKLHHVDVDRIEKELLELWQQAGKAGSEDEIPSVTRACSMNFILHDTDPNSDLGAEMLEDIALKHPCRAILALANPEAEKEHLEAFVTARCRLTSGKKSQICCEQINVRWEGKGTRQLASVVLPLRIADLPTWLWWHKARPTKEMIGPFLPFIDHLVVDTASMDGNLIYLFDLKDVAMRLDEDTALFDLNWTRLLPWRQSLARSFEHNCGLLCTEDLDLIDNVNIVVAEGVKPVSTQALLLVAWLANSLSWRFVGGERKSNGDTSMTFVLGRRRIHILVSSVKADVTPGSVVKCTMDFIGNSDETLVVSQVSGTPGLLSRITSGKEGSNGKKVDSEPVILTEKESSQLVTMLLDNPQFGEIRKDFLDLVCELAAEVK